jgi:NADH-quinone oxidoreductase subunit G
MPTLSINGHEVTVENGATVLQACEAAGVEIPRFCYHERLSIAGNCRMCLVEMEKAPKPIASCHMPAGDGMVIRTDTQTVKKAREGVMEFLLINHPLDCPICDQGGECDLQDQSVAYGKDDSRYDDVKRAVVEKDMGPLISTTMTRCIHCQRCVRFSTEVAGFDGLGAVGRGENVEITTYLQGILKSELSGNVIDLCPVGALTSKPYAFTARSWELKKHETIDVMDALGANIRLDTRGNQVMRIIPRLHEDVNEEWITDKTRFCYDGLTKCRLDQPWVRSNGKLKSATWDKAFDIIKKTINLTDDDAIAGVVGDTVDMESSYALKRLLAALGSNRVECRNDGAGLDGSNRAGYLFNTGIGNIENADYVLMIGADPRGEAALVASRMRVAVKAGTMTVANIGPAIDQAFAVEQLGNNLSFLSKIKGSNATFKALKAAERPMIILGQGALMGGDSDAVLAAAKELADKVGAISADWNGFNILHTAASRVGSLDMGLTTKRGMKGIYADAKARKLKAVFLLNADEVDMGALENTLKIYVGSHGDAGAAAADVVLPAAAFSEKAGTYTNMEGRVQLGIKTCFAPGDAREDWTIFRAFADIMKVDVGFDSFGELQSAMRDEFGHLREINVKPTAAWGAFGKKGDIKTKAMTTSVSDFYLTNAIARSSDVLNECSQLMTGENEGATGTNG